MAHRARLNKKKFRLFGDHWKSIFLFFVGGSFLFAGVLLLWASFMKIPDFSTFNDRKIVESTKIYDRTGKILLYDVHENVKRTIVPFEQMSPNLRNATIAIEDANFYHHYGIDPKSIVRAFVANITRGGLRQGGSTITQQVVKETLLTNDKHVTRKLKEVILSFKLEQAFSKDQILGLYLNENPYGGNIYGVGEASRVFFGKEPSELSLAQSAYLAALPNAPTYYSPYGNHRDKLDGRKNFVLKRMHDLGMIADGEYQTAVAEKVEFLPKEPRGMKAPHFVEMVKEYLALKYGERAVLENGYTVITTLDYELQKKAEDAISKFSEKMETEYGAKNMALVAIDPKNGQVLAMVGSRDYFDTKNEGNFNVALAHRQPGSAFKPFAYATAFKKGYTPETVLFDLPTNFSTGCDTKGVPLTPAVKKEDCYMPENYEGGYRGPISMRSSLAQSRNVTSVKTLYLAGLSDTIATARQMGITGLDDISRYGLSLVLGGGEVTLLDITGAYGVFANDGVRNETQSILRVEDKDGNTIEETCGSSEEVIPSEVARNITSVLSDNKARTPTFGATSSLYFPGKDVAVKTGTTNDYRDVWTVGYTPNIAVGMWAGNNDNSSIKKGNSAAFTVSLVWHAFMEDIFKNTPQERFIAPEPEDLTTLPAPLSGIWQGGEKYIIDTTSGKLATENTPTETRKIVVVPEVHSILYWVDKNNPRGPRPANHQNDPQFNLWEEPVRAWVATQNIHEGDRSGIPTEYDTNHTAESAPIISVAGVDFNQPHAIDEVLTATVISTGKYPLSRVEFFVNGQFVEKKSQAPFLFSFTPKESLFFSTTNVMSFVGYDSLLNKTVYTAQLQIQ
ncbi:MAG: penicillin-binding protein [Candidatus Yonathbacteria bacterium]|nr:penicillin-binding protein [Candidatus Yonathbacteria bacterium]